jgi:uncharacterized protein
MRVAIVGTGISGMLCARLLHSDHEVTVFEAGDYIGGHTNTVDVDIAGRRFAVDTGFIVCNDWTYPHFLQMLRRLGVATQPSDMSFSVRCKRTGLEYNGTSLNTLFAQRSNLLRPSFHRMIRDILRFNKEALELLDKSDERTTLGEYLDTKHYSREFLENYILPMGGAIWSAEPQAMRAFPARYFVQFFKNHGMLSVDERPEWRVVSGGSSRYMRALTQPFRDRIRLKSPVVSIRRFDTHVEVTSGSGASERFDHVIVSAHSDQALAMLSDASPAERTILGAIPYQENIAVLHTDESVMPKRKLAWAAWNYHLDAQSKSHVAVTYWMNHLQSLDAPVNFCVTLNDVDGIDPAQVLRRIRYHHPVYTTEGVAAQKRRPEISGVRRTWFCGAYWGYGFHEDGVNSALAVAQEFGKSLEDIEPALAAPREIVFA